ncbi:hypothetical protein BB559_002732 [Furculomyces boomerangus]|uniref:Zinc finger CHCC-type domain-containing protein n=2 Tax=Harpellales TaxID=61421 RepID=A0A2T9YSY1_9FUNG|nr:hypothetical protein BB559_002732 [Furculomyces boomerangus]PVZ96735.1 hypothetical protein BB558_007341 [Smittium angustum]
MLRLTQHKSLSRNFIRSIGTSKTRFVCSSSKLYKETSISSSDSANEIQPTLKVFNQAPNHPTIWSETQQPKEIAMSGPRFEQTALEDQPNPMAAIDLIAQEPVRLISGRKAFCDGGMGDLGHPRVYMNLDNTDTPATCVYCGLRFQQDPQSKHH